MRLQTLTPSDVQRFKDDGYVVVKQAFSPDDAAEMEQVWWSELAASHGIRRADRSTWRQICGDLKLAKRDPGQARMLTDRVCGVIDDLLGEGAWTPPRDWGRALVTFPEPGAWDVPTALWHWDSPTRLHRDRLNGLFVVAFVGKVAPRAGGTLILSGSPRLLLRQDRGLTPGHRDDAVVRRDLFHRSHPWLMALTGKGPSPEDRVAAFMETESVVDGVPLRVVELTGEPGDMVFCHPAMVHCVSPNRGERPRFMRIRQQLLTKEGRRLLGDVGQG